MRREGNTFGAALKSSQEPLLRGFDNKTDTKALIKSITACMGSFTYAVQPQSPEGLVTPAVCPYPNNKGYSRICYVSAWSESRLESSSGLDEVGRSDCPDCKAVPFRPAENPLGFTGGYNSV